MPKRQSVCFDYKKALEEKLNALPNKRKYKAFVRHLEVKYIDGRKPREHLELANLAIEHLTSRDDAKINVRAFTKCLEDIKHFLRDTLRPTSQGEPMIGVVRSTRVGNNNKLYKTETAFVAREFDQSNIGKCIHMDRGVFTSSHTTHETEEYVDDKNRFRDLLHRVGTKVIDRRIGQDQLAWRRIVNSITEEGLLSDILGMESRIACIEIVDIRPLSEDTTFQTFAQRSIRDFVNEKYINTRFVKYHVDMTSPFLVHVSDNPIDGLQESCFYKAIVTTYKISFDKYHANLKDVKRYNDRLTPQLVSQICLGCEYDESELNMTVEQASKFFKNYNLGLRIFDPRGHELFSHIPDTYHSKIRPRILDMVYKNNHIVPITDTKSFEQRSDDSLSDRYHFKTYGGTEAEYVLANGFDQMTSGIRNVLKRVKEDQNIHVVWNGAGLNDLVITFVKNGYTPTVQVRGGISITGMTLNNLEYQGHNIRIQVAVTGISNGDEEIKVGSIETYQKYRKLEAELMKDLIKPEYISEYNANTRAAMREYCVSIPTGAINTPLNLEEAPYVIDMCKHYASCLASAPHLMSISPFDNFVLAEQDDVLCRDRLYLVDILPGCTHPVYRMKDRTIMFYDELVDMEDVPHKVYAHIQLVLHPNVSLPRLIRDIFDPSGLYADIPIEMRKGLVNRAIGESGRKKNRRREATLYRNEDDAKMDIQKGGVKHHVAEGIWLVKTCMETELQDGYVPINEMIKSMARYHMAGLWRKLTALGCHVIGFKTDAIYFERNGVDIRDTELAMTMGDGIGKAKYFIDKDVGYPRAPMGQHVTRKYDFQRCDDTSALQCTVENIGPLIQPGTMVLGGAGCGKTHNTMQHVIGKYGCDKVLVVTAWNSQAKRVANEFKVVGITWHRLRGAKLDDTIRTGSHGYDVSSISAIVIDEIMLFEHRKLVKLAAYIETHSGIHFYATGDPKQLEAIGDVIDNERKIKILMSPKLFCNALSLHVNLRLDAADRDRMAALLVALDEAPTVFDFVTDNFQEKVITLDQYRAMKLKRAITFYNATSEELNREIHEYAYHSKHKLNRTKVIEGVRYYYGDTLLCRKKIRTTSGVMQVNYTYTIKAMNNTVFTLRDDSTTYEVSSDMITNHFALPYCSTVHSSQGDCISEPYAISDFASDHVTKNWMMCALTRCIRLDDVYFLITSLCGAFKRHEMKRMVHGYRAQDRAKGFKERTDVTVEWIDDAYMVCGGQCKYCGHHITFERRSRHRASVNRLNNSKGHNVGNIELCCWDCNNHLG